MTHTLHPEIEEAIEKMIKDMELPAEVWAKLFIIQSLGKYLHMPQPIENEPLPEKDVLGICDTTQNIMKDIRTYVYEFDDVQKMRLLALLDKYLSNFGWIKQSTPDEEVEQPKSQDAHKYIPRDTHWDVLLKWEQSTPQIELPAYVLNNLDYLWLLLDKMIEKSKSHLDKLKSLDK